jgi:hypothetical protein
LQRQAAAHAAACEVHDVVDQPRHPVDAVPHQADDRLGVLFRLGAGEQPDSGRKGSERVAQIVAEHCDELLAQFRRVALARQLRLARFQFCGGVDLHGNEFGKQLEHVDRLGILQPGGMRVDGAQRAKEGGVGQDNGHRDIALDAVQRRGAVSAKHRVLRHMVDDDGFTALPDFVADRGFDVQFAAGLQSEADLIEDGAANPALIGDPRDGCKAHSGRSAYDLENARHRDDTLNGSDIGCKIFHHHKCSEVPT